VISEWRVKRPGAQTLTFDPTSRRELLRIDEPQFNHNGGSLAFGPDENLYISVGDGGEADDLARGHAAGGNGQSLAPGNVLGKVLRIDPRGHNSRNGRYGIPAGNPRTGGEREIFAYGFRNPFRMSFDSRSGALYVGDVGQNDVEEVDVVTAGRNYGWPVKEGTFLFANRDTCDPAHGKGCAYQDSPGSPAGLTDPLAQYDHVDTPDLATETRVAVIGGYVYRGSRIDRLQGRYVFGDYSGEIGTPVAGHLFTLDNQNKVVEVKVPSRIGPDGRSALGIAVLGFGQDAEGELYVLANRSGTLADPGLTTVPGTSGEVLKLVPTRG
jgi:glucose/arabinose dehydrogenase